MAEWEKLPEHLIVWWRGTDMHETRREDFLGLSRLTPEAREARYRVISHQTSRAIQLIASFGGNPAVTGSWGNASASEQSRYGLSRGVPTNQMGHLHVVCYRDDAATTVMTHELDPLELLNFIAPWNHLLYTELGPTIAAILECLVGSSGAGTSATRFALRTHHPSGAIAIQEGYRIVFRPGWAFGRVLSLLTTIVETFEDIYVTLGESMRESFLNSSQEHTRVAGELRSRFHLTQQQAADLTIFLLRLRPTWGQARMWASGTRQRKPLDRMPLVADTFRDPIDPGIALTWPVHASGCFLIEEYQVHPDTIEVVEVKLFPGIASTSAATERVLGVVLRRV